MNVIKIDEPSLPTDTNFLAYDTKEFIFNTYKTSKKSGQQKEAIPEPLMTVINLYFKFHPLIKGKKPTKASSVPFLVYYSGKPLDKVNSITRILNKVFGKSVGSSMLRHIWLTHKYGDTIQEQQKDAEAMGHSVAQQQDYVKVAPAPPGV
jgi:integrase